MIKNKKIICVIPARLGSKRFFAKILQPIQGMSVLQRAYLSAKSIQEFDKVLIAIEHKDVEKHVKTFTKDYIYTDANCPSGSHRVLQCMQKSACSADVWVNWQADEPFIQRSMILDLLQGIHSRGDIWTLRTKIQEKEIASPHVVKVVTDKNQKALYFSRSPIPYQKTKTSSVYKHIGIYAFSTKALRALETLSIGELAQTESLEQLTFLENGWNIYAYETKKDTVGIDTEEDLHQAKEFFCDTLKGHHKI